MAADTTISQHADGDKKGEGGEAETSCAGLHARPKDWAFQNQCAHLDSMLFTARARHICALLSILINM